MGTFLPLGARRVLWRRAMAGMEKSTKLFIVQALGAIAICLSLTSLILVYLWMDDYLGTDQHMDPHKYGLEWDDTEGKLWNYHPLLMVTGFISVNVIGVLLYRLGGIDSEPARSNGAHDDVNEPTEAAVTDSGTRKTLLKILHVVFQSTALLLASLGLYAVFENHDAVGSENLYMAHSWVGMTTCIAFCLQWVMGILFFAIPADVGGFSGQARAIFMPSHVILGVFTMLGASAATVSGISEKIAYLGACADDDQMSAECRIANSLALTAIFAVLAALAALMLIPHSSMNDNQSPPSENSDDNQIPSEKSTLITKPSTYDTFDHRVDSSTNQY